MEKQPYYPNYSQPTPEGTPRVFSLRDAPLESAHASRTKVIPEAAAPAATAGRDLISRIGEDLGVTFSQEPTVDPGVGREGFDEPFAAKETAKEAPVAEEAAPQPVKPQPQSPVGLSSFRQNSEGFVNQILALGRKDSEDWNNPENNTGWFAKRTTGVDVAPKPPTSLYDELAAEFGDSAPIGVANAIVDNAKEAARQQDLVAQITEFVEPETPTAEEAAEPAITEVPVPPTPVPYAGAVGRRRKKYDPSVDTMDTVDASAIPAAPVVEAMPEATVQTAEAPEPVITEPMAEETKAELVHVIQQPAVEAVDPVDNAIVETEVVAPAQVTPRQSVLSVGHVVDLGRTAPGLKGLDLQAAGSVAPPPRGGADWVKQYDQAHTAAHSVVAIRPAGPVARHRAPKAEDNPRPAEPQPVEPIERTPIALYGAPVTEPRALPAAPEVARELVTVADTDSTPQGPTEHQDPQMGAAHSSPREAGATSTDRTPRNESSHLSDATPHTAERADVPPIGDLISEIGSQALRRLTRWIEGN